MSRKKLRNNNSGATLGFEETLWQAASGRLLVVVGKSPLMRSCTEYNYPQKPVFCLDNGDRFRMYERDTAVVEGSARCQPRLNPAQSCSIICTAKGGRQC